MPKTSAQLAKEIEHLEAQARSMRKRELPQVVARIKQAIAAYGLTANDLGLADGMQRNAAKSAGRAGRPANSGKRGTKAKQVAMKYRNANGGTWGGIGKRPDWLRAALAAGQSLESFLVDAGAPAAANPSNLARSTSRRSAAPARPKTVSRVKFKDDAGHTWSGFGPTPAWLKAALASGKTLAELTA